jgi:thiamine biosynthesis protein ThiI
MDRCLVCHYHEIGLKRNNRSYFEERLRDNMCRALGDLPFRAVRRLSGRLVVEVPDDFPLDEGAERLRNVFGLSSVSPGWVANPELDELKTSVWQLIKDRSFDTFRITTRRADKRYPFTSQQVN